MKNCCELIKISGLKADLGVKSSDEEDLRVKKLRKEVVRRRRCLRAWLGRKTHTNTLLLSHSPPGDDSVFIWD